MSRNSHLKFSIITPTFNRASLITTALDSVKAQSYRPLEILLIDDGSTDQTRQIVEKWIDANMEPEALTVHYEYQENQGQSAARNRGLELASGDLVQYLDSDDRLAPHRLATLAECFMLDHELDFIQTGFDGFCGDCGETNEQHYGNPEIDPIILALRGRLWANSLRSAFRRDAISDLRWNTDMTCFEDLEYVVRVLFQVRKGTSIREISASARRGGGLRVSDQLRSYDGRRQRILCEQQIACGLESILKSEPSRLPQREIAAFVSRIYGLALRSLAAGWPDHAATCREMAAQFDVPLDRIGRRRKRIFESGRWAASTYEKLGQIKQTLRGSKVVRKHQCNKPS